MFCVFPVVPLTSEVEWYCHFCCSQKVIYTSIRRLILTDQGADDVTDLYDIPRVIFC